MPDLVMPKMGDSMEEGTILRWLKNVGDTVVEEEIIFEIQTEKATIEVPASDAGVLSEILVKEGETVPIGTPIGRIGSGSSDAAPAAAATPKSEPAPTEVIPAPAAATSPTHEPVGRSTDPAPMGLDRDPGAEPTRVKASPLARKRAAEHKLDLARVAGTGPGGRIIEADVTEALQKQPATPAQPAATPGAPAPAFAAPAGVPAANLPGEAKSLSPMRKIIAGRLSQSKQTVPHFYVTVDVDMRAAAKLRAQFNGSVDAGRKVSFNDLVLKACALALEKHPAVNSQWNGDSIQVPSVVNVGVAVSLEEGLIVPVVRDAAQKSISGIGREVRALAEKARAGKLTPADYSGGTFTVSNLGMYDIVQFQAIINPPEAAIMAVGAVRDAPIVEEGAVVAGKQMYLTLSVDHRVVDGSVAAVFLQDVKKLLENPMALFG